MPSDVTGVSVFNQETRDFEFKPGGVFANIVVGDEINRASPKTQSALLECMEERQVTVDGTTYALEPPFMVIATQNPVEMEGTYPLPEAQRDRFMARLAMGYPGAEDEMEMIGTHGGADALDQLEPVTDAAHVAKLVGIVRGIYVSPRSRSTASPSPTPAGDRPNCASGHHRGRPCTSCGRPRRGRLCTTVSTCSPTTFSNSRRLCSPIACCLLPRPRSAAVTRRRSSPTC